MLKRAYEAPTKDDGFRILVDRIWPRGVTKDFAKIDLWSKDITPSAPLRKWFSHDPLKWDKFTERYIGELENNPDTIEEFIHMLQQHDTVTLVYGAKDTKHTHALVLKEYVKKRFSSSNAASSLVKA